MGQTQVECQRESVLDRFKHRVDAVVSEKIHVHQAFDVENEILAQRIIGSPVIAGTKFDFIQQIIRDFVG